MAWPRRLSWLGAALAYAALAWLLAPELVANELDGSDWGNALSFADWIARSFPAMPFWFPYQGGGVSPSSGYAITPMYAVAALHALGLELVVAARALAFVAMVAAALGVAALARALSIPLWASFAAGALSLLPPAAWNLLVYVGFFANTIAAALATWFAAALVAYARRGAGRLDRRGVLLFAAAVVLGAVTFLAHPVVGAMPLLLGAGAAASLSRRAAARVATAGAAALLLASGAAFAFVQYNRLANLDGTNDFTPEVLAQQTIPLDVLVGAAEIVPHSGLLESMSLTPLLIVLAGIGVPFAVARRPLRGLLVATAFAALYLASLEVQIAVVRLFAPIAPILGFRGILIFAIAGLSVLAGAGLAGIAALGPRRVAAVGVAALTLVAVLALEGPGYGPRRESDPPFLRGRLPAILAAGEMIAGHDRKIRGGLSAALQLDEADVEFVSARLTGLSGRADVSPRLGNVLKMLPLFSDARVLNLYTFTLSLFHQSWADEQQALFLANEYGVAGASVDEMAAWFGIERVAFHAREDDAGRYRAAGWRVEEGENVVVASSPARRTFASFRERGVVLHVGRVSNETFRNTYRLATAGALPFDLGWLVQGPACVDDVSDDDLARIDVLILEDHCERDRARSAARIGAWVERGGRLFVETGWEYSRYFEIGASSAPAFLPAERLRWQDVSLEPKLVLAAGDVALDGVDASRFGDFRYEDGTWNVSGPEGALRPWARPVLTADGKPIVAAGRLGEGRVVWSGLNLVAHARAKQSEAERSFYAALMRWLLDGRSAAPSELAVAEPEEAGGTVVAPRSGWLLWRESPAFAALTPGVPATYRAGPGLLLAPVASDSYRVEQQPSAGMRVAAGIGAVATISLGAWTALGLGLGGAADPGGAFGTVVAALRRRATALAADDEDDE